MPCGMTHTDSRVDQLYRQVLRQAEELKQLRSAVARAEPTALEVQLQTISRLLAERPSLNAKDVAAELHCSVKTAHRRLTEMARRGMAHVFFEQHPESPNTSRIRAVRPDRAVVQLD